jgi:hypothetical protein
MTERRRDRPRLEALACPLCGGLLEPTRGRHGLVWLCRTCEAGAATLPILRQVAPRAFVNHLWQAALHAGRASALVCPSCARPFTEFVGAGAGMDPQQLEVCLRCFWVWLSRRTLSALSARAAAPGALVERTALRGSARAGGERAKPAVRRLAFDSPRR